MKKNRFYDQDPTVSQAVQMMLMLRGQIRTLAAESLSSIAETEYHVKTILQEAKTLGSDKILALYKSKHKKREYDYHPALHRALNYLMLLSESKQRLLAFRIVGLMTQWQDYVTACGRFSIFPTSEDMVKISRAYLNQGPEEARKLIRLLETPNYRYGPKAGNAGVSLSLPSEMITEEKNMGLQVRRADKAKPAPRQE